MNLSVGPVPLYIGRVGTYGFIQTHTSHIHITPVSNKNYSLGYNYTSSKKKLNQKLSYFYGKNNFFDTSLESSYVIMYLVFS